VFTVIALDPGGSTGWALYQAQLLVTPGGTPEWYDEKWLSGTLNQPDHHRTLYGLLEQHHTQQYHVVVESFEYRNKSRPGLELVSKEYIGVAKLFCQDRKVPYYSQTASQGKGLVKDYNLRNLGLWFGGRESRHAMDAARHLVYWLVTGEYKRKDITAKGWPNI
jgi:hypothetical protein